MKFTARKALIVAAIAALPVAASAELSFNIGAVSLYKSRGIDQDSRSTKAFRPAIQGGVDYSFDNGIYVGNWNSTGKFGNADLEMDFYVGYIGKITEDLSFDVGVVRYLYPNSGGGWNGNDAYVGLSYGPVSAKYYQGVSGSVKKNKYLTLGVELPISDAVSFNASVGLMSGGQRQAVAVARAVAFERLLNSGDGLLHRLLGIAAGSGDHPLVHIATDGETYGHHHRFGEMALAWALEQARRQGLARLTNYGEYVERHPPTWEVEIAERTSWSCAHGVERWRGDCGCRLASGTSQAWRTPLRHALEWLASATDALFEAEGRRLFADPWAARDAAIALHLDPTPDRRGFLRGAGLATMGAVLGAAIPFSRNMPAGMIPAALAQTPDEFVLQGKEGLIIRNDRPINIETPGHLLGSTYQGIGDARLGGRMAGIADDLQLAVGPGLVQRPGVVQRADGVVAAMHDDARQMGDLRHVTQQLVRLEKGVVDEVVALDTGDGQRSVRLAEALDHLGIRAQGGGAPFPGRPGLGRVHLGDLVGAGQALVESLHQIAAFVWRNRREVVLPVVGEQAAGALLVEPAEFLRPTQEDAAQNQPVHALRMRLRIGQRQGRAPGAAEQHELVYPQVLANAFDIADQRLGGVVLQTGVRGGAATATLIEGDDTVEIGIEVSAA